MARLYEKMVEPMERAGMAAIRARLAAEPRHRSSD